MSCSSHSPRAEIQIGSMRLDEQAWRREAGRYQGSLQERHHLGRVGQILRHILCPEGDDQAADQAIEAWLSRIEIGEVDEAHCQAYYREHPQRYRSEDLLELRHILFAAAPGDEQGRAAARQQAEDCLRSLQEDCSCFAAQAARYSACPSAAQGGHLGLIGRGQTVAEFEDAVFQQAVGLLGELVESRYGWHVVDLVARHEGQLLPYEAVCGDVRERLRRQLWIRQVQQHLQALWQTAGVKGLSWPVASKAEVD